MWLIFSNKDKSSPKPSREEIKSLFSVYKSPAIVWPFSKAYKALWFLFCSGQVAYGDNTMRIIEWWIEEETKQICRNIWKLLEDNWTSVKNVVKTTVYLKNMNDYEKMNEVYKNYFVLKPARSVVEVSQLQKNALIEIEVIAQIK